VATVKELDERLTRVEHTISKAKGAFAVLALVMTGVGAIAAWTLKTVHDLDVHVAALTTLVTNKLPVIAVTRLGAGAEEAAKAYSATEALMRAAASSKSGLKPETIANVGKILASQVPQQTSNSAYWQLTSYLIDQKSPSNVSLPRDCLNMSVRKDDFAITVDAKTGEILDKRVMPPKPEEAEEYTFLLSDCVLQLDYPDFWNTGMGKKIAYEATQHPKGVLLTMDLSRVHVVYKGGPLIPVSAIHFQGCSFEFSIVVPPTLAGRRVGLSLLEADLTREVSVRNLDLHSTG